MPIEEVIHQCRQLMYAHSKRILDDQLIVLLRLAYTQGEIAGTNNLSKKILKL